MLRSPRRKYVSGTPASLFTLDFTSRVNNFIKKNAIVPASIFAKETTVSKLNAFLLVLTNIQIECILSRKMAKGRKNKIDYGCDI